MRVIVGRSHGRGHRPHAHVSQAGRRWRDRRRHHGRRDVQIEIVEDVDQFFRGELLEENEIGEGIVFSRRRFNFDGRRR